MHYVFTAFLLLLKFVMLPWVSCFTGLDFLWNTCICVSSFPGLVLALRTCVHASLYHMHTCMHIHVCMCVARSLFCTAMIICGLVCSPDLFEKTAWNVFLAWKLACMLLPCCILAEFLVFIALLKRNCHHVTLLHCLHLHCLDHAALTYVLLSWCSCLVFEPLHLFCLPCCIHFHAALYWTCLDVLPVPIALLHLFYACWFALITDFLSLSLWVHLLVVGACLLLWTLSYPVWPETLSCVSWIIVFPDLCICWPWHLSNLSLGTLLHCELRGLACNILSHFVSGHPDTWLGATLCLPSGLFMLAFV